MCSLSLFKSQHFIIICLQSSRAAAFRISTMNCVESTLSWSLINEIKWHYVKYNDRNAGERCEKRNYPIIILEVLQATLFSHDPMIRVTNDLLLLADVNSSGTDPASPINREGEASKTRDLNLVRFGSPSKLNEERRLQSTRTSSKRDKKAREIRQERYLSIMTELRMTYSKTDKWIIRKAWLGRDHSRLKIEVDE